MYFCQQTKHMSKFDVIVLGSGPGGYVTAIRASQLGLKTAIVEKERLGGVCLNWGCIPTKALIKSAQVFDYLKHAEDYGLKVDNYDKDFDAVVNRSRNVADTMSKGVQFLMKKNKIEVIFGYGTLKKGKQVAVTAEDGTESIHEADHIIIATGARSRELPSLPQDGKKVIGYREAMTLAMASLFSLVWVLQAARLSTEIKTNSRVFIVFGFIIILRNLQVKFPIIFELLQQTPWGVC